MATQKYNPADAEPFGIRQFVHTAVAASSAVLLLFVLAAFGMQEQEIADPITTSPIPQPDWLFMAFFQVTRYFQNNMEMIGVFWIPAGIFLGMFILPFIDRGTTRKQWFKWSLVPVSLAVFLALTIVTSHTCSTTPIWSCASCHKKSFGKTFAVAPRVLADFSSRHDNKWLALHYRYPQYFWMMDPHVPSW
jgi:ubiquinol-cytochrome c reductase cytochrome b subunit